MDEATARFHTLAGELKTAEDELSKTSALMAAVVQYAKTRPVFDGYKAARYSKKYLAEHETELADYRAAQQDMRELTAAKGNLDHLYRATEGRGHKAQER